MKPYQRVAIAECGEPLVELPSDQFSLVMPHPYMKLGAPYGDRSPFFVRQGVRDRLLQAHAMLQETHPGWTIEIFDAYRPVAVQQFMVEYTFEELARDRNIDRETLTETQREELYQQVYQFWAMPSLNPETPPPHSTGAAIDITLVNASGNAVDMGSPIDEVSARSFPNHFAENADPQAQQYHQHRELLHHIMSRAGFQRHWNEWWHFSYGDQIWAWLLGQSGESAISAERNSVGTAKYGRAEV